MNSEQLIEFVDTVVFHETHRHLRDVEIWILEGTWNGQSYKEIAINHNYSPLYLLQDIGPKFWKFLSTVFQEEIKKCNYRTSLERHFNAFITKNSYLSNPDEVEVNTEILLARKSLEATFQINTDSITHCDWGEAPDISHTFEREQLLESLENLVFKNPLAAFSHQPCRILSLLGMAGIGKTILCSQLTQRLSAQFDIVIWRSLRNVPDAHSTIKDWIQQLCPDAERLPNTTFSEDLLDLLDHLCQYRCLLILDNFDSVLAPGSSAGAYRPHLKEYGQLLRCIADTKHQSCLILTSRTSPKGLMEREGTHLPVQSYAVPGLQAQDIAKIFKLKGCNGFNKTMIESLTTYYGGNPLALNCFAAMPQELTGGNVANFLAQFKPEELHLNEIETLLHQQLSDLRTLEKYLLCQIADSSDRVTLSKLVEVQHLNIPNHSLIMGMQSLLRRSLIEQKEQSFYLQPYVLNYIKEHFIAETPCNRGTLAAIFLPKYKIPAAS